jgi:transcriptional regulator with XRE-family HTH domain
VESRAEAICIAVSERMRITAETLFLTQTELSRRTTISQSQISKLFRGERGMTVFQMLELSDALGLSPVSVLRDAIAEIDGE